MSTKHSFTLNDICLGYTDGNNEALFISDFEKYYCDCQGHVSAIQAPDKFLLLGRKGTGKTLLAQYLNRISKFDSQKFVSIKSFRDFQFHKIVQFRISNNTYSEYLPIMEWMILLDLAELITQDNSIKNIVLQNALTNFLKTNFGLKITGDKVIEKTSKKQLQGSLLSALSGSIENTTKKRMGDYLEYLDDLRETIVKLLIGSDCKYCILYDDLDDKFSLSDIYKESIQSLIYAVVKINSLLLRHSSNAKIILILRTDAYNSLNSPDLNKYRIDNSLTLDWIGDSSRYSPLIDMILLKIQKSIEGLVTSDIDRLFEALFPREINGRRPERYLLDMGFCRPRDLINMLNLVKNAFPHLNRFEEYGFVQTKTKYSQYLLQEVRNEMSGHLEQDEIDAAISILKSLKKPNFNFNSLCENLPYFPLIRNKEHLTKLVKELFRFSAIGNEIQDKENNIVHYTWAHLDASSEPDFTARFSIHHGLRLALKAEGPK